MSLGFSAAVLVVAVGFFVYWVLGYYWGVTSFPIANSGQTTQQALPEAQPQATPEFPIYPPQQDTPVPADTRTTTQEPVISVAAYYICTLYDHNVAKYDNTYGNNRVIAVSGHIEGMSEFGGDYIITIGPDPNVVPPHVPEGPEHATEFRRRQRILRLLSEGYYKRPDNLRLVSSVDCYFDQSHQTSLMNLKTGCWITVIGDCDSGVTGPILRYCRLYSQYTPQLESPDTAQMESPEQPTPSPVKQDQEEWTRDERGALHAKKDQDVATPTADSATDEENVEHPAANEPLSSDTGDTAKPAQATPAQPPGPSDHELSLLADYGKAAAKRIKSQCLSSKEGARGTVRIEFDVDKQGHLLDVRLIESSGYSDLDVDAIDATRAAFNATSKVIPFPIDVTVQQWTFRLGIAYPLD